MLDKDDGFEKTGRGMKNDEAANDGANAFGVDNKINDGAYAVRAALSPKSAMALTRT